jgi:hypothetical protein
VGGLGSGNRYRFDKKTTTDECRSLDVRRFHREGLLKSGHFLVALVACRTRGSFHRRFRLRRQANPLLP